MAAVNPGHSDHGREQRQMPLAPQWPVTLLLAITLALSSAAGIAAEATDYAESARTEAPPIFPATVPEGVPSLQMSTDFVSPALAIGVYRPVGQVASRGIRVEPFTLRAWMQTGIGYDDNVALSNTNKISSMFFALNPSFSIGLEGLFHRYFAVYRGNYARYSSASSGNYENHNLSLVANDEWSTRLRTAFQYDYLRGQDPRGSTGSASIEADPWSIHAARGTVSYGAGGAQGGLNASLGYSQRRYLDRTADSRDYEQFDVGGGFSYRLAPKTYALAQVRRADITHQAAPTLDSTEMQYALGLRWDATAKTTGTLRVGYMMKDFSDAALPDPAIPTYEAAVTWSPLTYSVLSLTAQRTFAEAVEPGSSTIVDSHGALTWDHVWTGRTRSTFVAVVGRLNHEGLGRTDHYHNFVVRGSYMFARWLYLGAEYRREGRDSNASGFDYSRNIFLVTVESAL